MTFRIGFAALVALAFTSGLAQGRARADDSFAAFGVPRSDLLDTPYIYPLASGTIPRPGLGRPARRTIWDRSFAHPQAPRWSFRRPFLRRR